MYEDFGSTYLEPGYDIGPLRSSVQQKVINYFIQAIEKHWNNHAIFLGLLKVWIFLNDLIILFLILII
jgi:hypothetical protein